MQCRYELTRRPDVLAQISMEMDCLYTVHPKMCIHAYF